MGERLLAELSTLSDEELLSGLTQAFETNRLAAYQPYPWQREFHAIGDYATERLLICANGCITPWTSVETVPRSRPIADMIGKEGFDVRSWDGESECVVRADPVFLKGIEPAFRFLLDNGEAFDCTSKHRVLTSDGWLEAGQLVHAASGLHWSQTVQDFLASCGADDDLCDERLRQASGSGLALPPSISGARTRGLFLFSRRDAAAHISRYSHAYRLRGRYAIGETALQLSGLFEQFEDPATYIASLSQTESHRAALRFVAESSPDSLDRQAGHRRFFSPLCEDDSSESNGVADKPEPSMGKGPRRTRYLSWERAGQASLESLHDDSRIGIFYPSSHPVLEGGRRIVAVVPLGFQPILDFTVPETACYLASGVVHHNTGKTYSVSAELAMHLTGLYPEWWEGYRLNQGGFEVWLGSIDNEMQKIGLQESLFGPDLEDGLGTGFVPRHCIEKINRRQSGIKDVLDEAFITHTSGKRVKVRLKTFEQGEKKWQSGKPKIIVWDEEPDENNVDQAGVFMEMQTRLVRNAGIFFGCRTPLYGMTQLITHFMESENPHVRWIGATWDDAPHMDEDAKQKAREAYRMRPGEEDTREKGVPLMGEGRIFGAGEASFVVDPFPLPDHWARIKGIDFGLAHPAAVANLAWDRDTNTVYLYKIWREKIDRTSQHIDAINADGEEWIPVAWPHDGEKRDPKSGVQLVQNYRKKCTMLAKSARYKNDVGGTQSVWKIVDDINQRLSDGTFKVFRTCKPWLEEYRSYHSKDGVIVARKDDALKASFYGVMMLRFARSRSVARAGLQEIGMAPFRTSA